MPAIRHGSSRATAGLSDPIARIMGLALGEKARARPRFAGESSFVVDLPRCACEGLAPENVVLLLARTVVMRDAREAAVIVVEAFRLMRRPERASHWTCR